MLKYEKIDNNNFVEVKEKRKHIKKVDLIQRRNGLKAVLDDLMPPTNTELIEHGKIFHPYYMDKARLSQEWQELKDLIEYLQSL